MYHFWYNVCCGTKTKILEVVFFRAASGREPLRIWLKDLGKADRRLVGEDIKTAQFGWPIGMPLIRKLEPDLWEIRTRIENGITRTIFTVDKQTMVLLHGFVKKSQATPPKELAVVRKRLALYKKGE